MSDREASAVLSGEITKGAWWDFLGEHQVSAGDELTVRTTTREWPAPVTVTGQIHGEVQFAGASDTTYLVVWDRPELDGERDHRLLVRTARGYRRCGDVTRIALYD